MSISWVSCIAKLTQLIDLHISSRSIISKKIEQVYSGTKVNYSGKVTGVGLAFNFLNKRTVMV